MPKPIFRSVSLRADRLDALDQRRGDVPLARYIDRILEAHLVPRAEPTIFGRSLTELTEVFAHPQTDQPTPARPKSRPKRQPAAPPSSTDDPSPAADPAPPPAPSPPPNIRFCLRCPRPTDPAHEWGRCDCPCHDPDAINDDARQKGQAEKRAAAEAL